MSAVAVPVSASPTRRRSYPTAWWGMAMLILTEAMVFAILLAAYLFLRATSPHWPPLGTELPDLRLGIPFSIVLWGSSLPMIWAERAIEQGRVGAVRVGLALSWLMGAAFVGYTVEDFHALHFGWRDSAYASAFYTIVGLHAAHVVIGLLMGFVVQLKAAQGKLSAGRHLTLRVVALYWHFVDAVWVAVFGTLFLAVHWQ